MFSRRSSTRHPEKLLILRETVEDWDLTKEIGTKARFVTFSILCFSLARDPSLPAYTSVPPQPTIHILRSSGMFSRRSSTGTRSNFSS